MTSHEQSNHYKDIDLICAYLDGDLADDARRGFEVRLGSEPELRAELAELHATTTLLSELAPITPPRSFTLDPTMVRPSRSMFSLARVLQFSGGLAGLVLLFIVGARLLAGNSGYWASSETMSAAQPPAVAMQEEVAPDAAATGADQAAAPAEYADADPAAQDGVAQESVEVTPEAAVAQPEQVARSQATVIGTARAAGNTPLTTAPQNNDAVTDGEPVFSTSGALAESGSADASGAGDGDVSAAAVPTISDNTLDPASADTKELVEPTAVAAPAQIQPTPAGGVPVAVVFGGALALVGLGIGGWLLWRGRRS